MSTPEGTSAIQTRGEKMAKKLKSGGEKIAELSKGGATSIWNELVNEKGKNSADWIAQNYPMAIGMPLNLYTSVKFGQWAEAADDVTDAAKSASKLRRGINKAKKQIGSVMDLAGDASDYFDMIDPYGYNQEVSRNDFDGPAAMLFDNYQMQRARWLEQTALQEGDTPSGPNTQLQKSLINPPSEIETLPKTSTRVGELQEIYPALVRHYTVPRLGREDLGLDKCMYYDATSLNPDQDNFRLVTTDCPAKYQAFYNEYYKQTHPDTQIVDCVASDFIDSEQYLKDIEDGTADSENYIVPLTTDEAKQWFPCAESEDPAEKGKFFKTRYRIEYRAAQNGGKPCDPPVVDRRECPPIPCEMSPWIDMTFDTDAFCSQPGNAGYASYDECINTHVVYTTASTEEKSWTQCTSEGACGEWEKKIAAGTATDDEKAFYDLYKCGEVKGKTYSARYRNVLKAPENGAPECPSFVEYNTERCGAKDCKMSKWIDMSFDTDGFCKKPENLAAKGYASYDDCMNKHTVFVEGDDPKSWTACGQSAFCMTETDPVLRQIYKCSEVDGGQIHQARYRTIDSFPENGGKECDEVVQYRFNECGPVDCKLSDPIDMQRTTDTTTVYAAPDGGWSTCGVSDWCKDLKEKISLGVDIETNSWLYSAYDCSKIDSDQLHQARYRNVLTQPENGGAECPPVAEYRFDECGKKDCVMSPYIDLEQTTETTTVYAADGESAWSSCGVSDFCKDLKGKTSPAEVESYNMYDCSKVDDGKIHQARYRNILAFPENGGAECPPVAEYRTAGCAAIDCKLSDPVDLTLSTRIETVYTTNPETAWSECGTSGLCTGLKQKIASGTASATDRAVYNSYDCSKVDSGQVHQARYYDVEVEPANGGAACPPLAQYRFDQCGPVDCQLSPYIDLKNSTDTTTVYAEPDSAWSECGVSQWCMDLKEKKSAGTITAAETAVYDAYDCSTVDGGQLHQVRYRGVATDAKNGGKECGKLAEYRFDRCSPVDCQVGPWIDLQKTTNDTIVYAENPDTAWSVCGQSSMCVDVKQKIALGTATTEDRAIYDRYDCSKVDAGQLHQARFRDITEPAANGGKSCPKLAEYRFNCGSEDCETSEYTSWSECGTSSVCVSLKEKIQAGIATSSEQNLYNDWNCGLVDNNQLHQARYRNVIKPSKNGGKECGPLAEYRFNECGKIDCQLSPFIDTKLSTPTTTVFATDPEAAWTTCGTSSVCVNLKEKIQAGTATETDYALFSSYDCEKVANGEVHRARYKTVQKQPQNGGTACGKLAEYRFDGCEKVDCQMGDWSQWGDCTTSIFCVDLKSKIRAGTATDADRKNYDYMNCGVVDEGQVHQARTRDVLVQPKNGGAGCPAPIEYKFENCGAVDCQVSDWLDLTSPTQAFAASPDASWSSCIVGPDGKLRRERHREVQVQPKNGGKECSPLVEYTYNGCEPVDCVLSEPKPFMSGQTWYVYKLETTDKASVLNLSGDIAATAKSYLDPEARISTPSDVSGVTGLCGFVQGAGGLVQSSIENCPFAIYLTCRGGLQAVEKVFGQFAMTVVFVRQLDLQTNLSVCNPPGFSALCKAWGDSGEMNPERQAYCDSYGQRRTKLMIRDILREADNGGKACGDLFIEVNC